MPQAVTGKVPVNRKPVVMENIGNVMELAKQKSSPCLAKMPPLSPKLVQKKSTARCPSFLNKSRDDSAKVNGSELQTDK